MDNSTETNPAMAIKVMAKTDQLKKKGPIIGMCRLKIATTAHTHKTNP